MGLKKSLKKAVKGVGKIVKKVGHGVGKLGKISLKQAKNLNKGALRTTGHLLKGDVKGAVNSIKQTGSEVNRTRKEMDHAVLKGVSGNRLTAAAAAAVATYFGGPEAGMAVYQGARKYDQSGGTSLNAAAMGAAEGYMQGKSLGNAFNPGSGASSGWLADAAKERGLEGIYQAGSTAYDYYDAASTMNDIVNDRRPTNDPANWQYNNQNRRVV
jgi:hypothetical protein